MEDGGGGIDLSRSGPCLRSCEGASPGATCLKLVAGLLLAGSLIAAAPAAGQGDGATTSTTTTTPTDTTPGAPAGEPAIPVDLATVLPDGRASIPAGAPSTVVRAIKAANKIRRRPYIWGGGHRSFRSKGYDCSGAVSYVLHAARLLRFPLVSGQLARWGLPGYGTWITVFANRSHTYMVIAGLRFDTSPRGEWIDQGRGPRWRYTSRMGIGFAARYYPGL
jgi:hypothetical protein